MTNLSEKASKNPKKPRRKNQLTILEDQEKEEEKSPLTLAELTGIENENILNEKIANLLNIVDKLEKVNYGEQLSYIGNREDQLMFRSILEERKNSEEYEDDDYETVEENGENYDLKQLSLTVSEKSGDNSSNMSLLEELKKALEDLHINFWPEKDAEGNDVLVIDYPKDLEVIRRIFSPQLFLDYRQSLLQKRAELEKERDRQKTEKQKEKVEKILMGVNKVLMSIENKVGFLVDENKKATVNPLRELFQFGGRSISKRQEKRIKKDVSEQALAGNKKVEDSDTEEDLETLDDFFINRKSDFDLGLLLSPKNETKIFDEESFEEVSVLVENQEANTKNDFEPITPEVAKQPYYRKYVWYTKENFINYVEKEGLSIDVKTLGAGKVLFNSETKEVVSRTDREIMFLAARDWANENGNTDAKNALREVLLMNRNFIIWVIKMLKDKVGKTFGQISSDDLFQMANLAILKAVQNYTPDLADSGHHLNFLRNYIESGMRRLAYVKFGIDNTRKGVAEPVSLKYGRKKVDDIRAELKRLYPNRDIEEIEIARELAKRELIYFVTEAEFVGDLSRNDSVAERGTLLYRYYKHLLKINYFYNEVPYEDVFEDPNMDLSEVDLNGKSLFVEPIQIVEVEQRELEKIISQTFAGLTPREERVLRMRYGITFGNKFLFIEELKSSMNSIEKDEYESISKEMQENPSVTVRESYRIFWKKYLQKYFSENKKPTNYGATTNYEVDGLTFEEIGEKFNVNRERIRQILEKALRKLKHPTYSRKLSHFLPEDHWNSPGKVAKRKTLDLRVESVHRKISIKENEKWALSYDKDGRSRSLVDKEKIKEIERQIEILRLELAEAQKARSEYN